MKRQLTLLLTILALFFSLTALPTLSSYADLSVVVTDQAQADDGDDDEGDNEGDDDDDDDDDDDEEDEDGGGLICPPDCLGGPPSL